MLTVKTNVSGPCTDEPVGNIEASEWFSSS